MSCVSSRSSATTKRKLKCCKYCQFTDEDENPCPSRHSGDCRRFANEVECLNCRNYTNSKLVPDKERLLSYLKKPGNLEPYRESTWEYARLFDADPTKKMTVDRVGQLTPPRFLQRQQELVGCDKTFWGWFWQVWVLGREKIPYNPDELESHGGELGLYTVRPQPAPGCVEVTTSMVDRTISGKTLGYSGVSLCRLHQAGNANKQGKNNKNAHGDKSKKLDQAFKANRQH